MMNEMEIKKLMCEIGKRVYDRNMAAANDGNFSVKISDNEFLCTPTGVSKGFMTPEYICKVDGKGNVIEANGNFRPSSEIKMHIRVYEKRPDVNAVVHAHPSFATSFAIAGIPLTAPIMPEAVISLGCVPIADYGTPSTMEIPDNIEMFLPCHDAVLLENQIDFEIVSFCFLGGESDAFSGYDKYQTNLELLVDSVLSNYEKFAALDGGMSVIGVSTSNYYTNYWRIDEAKKMLLNTDHSLTDIAEKVGFHSNTHFSSYFKQFIGISPLRFRKEYQNKL